MWFAYSLPSDVVRQIAYVLSSFEFHSEVSGYRLLNFEEVDSSEFGFGLGSLWRQLMQFIWYALIFNNDYGFKSL